MRQKSHYFCYKWEVYTHECSNWCNLKRKKVFNEKMHLIRYSAILPCEKNIKKQLYFVMVVQNLFISKNQSKTSDYNPSAFLQRWL
jgi:hypothetical protein